ncbi:Fe-S oxidoreductase [Caldisphaera lagunensis DSM 15908]|uniref:Fe-S oxidoreductase n=1 Tax=Caldisphaera lagunensis (strain DSM 15908 / JCM 11604 / ANMR 0165 / IC-154) TaxID=1056495 RepID=L0AAU7_CALLD|nr:radical SAM protein [Caldisphaera lagunensis]AFZ70140.1 Fe-S oxidoreductase [Caldisphaera lagunensis DSM 15908]
MPDKIIEKELINKKYNKNMIKVALFYPSIYSVAMSSLVFHKLYFLLNQLDDIYLQRFYMPSLTGKPIPMRSFENGMPLKDFDYIFIPVHYELDYINIVKALIGSNIEIYSSKRNKPKIIIGGPTITANPEPLAELADIEVIGDLEAVWERIIDIIYGGNIDAGYGLYVPSLGKHEVRVAFSNYFDSLTKRILTNETTFTLAVEVMRGCPFNCLFCMESYISRPVRYKKSDDIINEVEELNKRYNDRISLIGLTVNSHPEFKNILKNINERKLNISLPSLRAELLDEESIELIAKLGQQSLTIAPESSERVRFALGKEIKDEDIIKVSKYASKFNLNIKAYFITSIPGETNDDLKSIIDLTYKIKKLGVKKIHLSVNPLIIKPRTPLQWLPMSDENAMKIKINYLKRNSNYDDFTTYDPLLALVQASISLSDRDVLKYLIQMAIEGGNRSSYRNALKNGLSDIALKGRSEPFPWDHIKDIINNEYLKERYIAFKEKMGLK